MLDDAVLESQVLRKMDKIFAVNDAGNSGSDKNHYNLAVGYDHEIDGVFEQFLSKSVGVEICMGWNPRPLKSSLRGFGITTPSPVSPYLSFSSG